MDAWELTSGCQFARFLGVIDSAQISTKGAEQVGYRPLASSPRNATPERQPPHCPLEASTMAIRERVVVVDHPGHHAREHDAAGRTDVVWQPLDLRPTGGREDEDSRLPADEVLRVTEGNGGSDLRFVDSRTHSAYALTYVNGCARDSRTIRQAFQERPKPSRADSSRVRASWRGRHYAQGGRPAHH